MVFGPDGRLYMTLANFSGPNAASVESFAYSPSGGLSDERTEVSTGGALGIGFGPVSLGVYGQPGVQTVTGMYLTDTARTINGNDVSNLRVLTQDQNGVWGGPDGGTDTIIVQNIPAGWHQADQIIIKQNADGTSTLYVGIGVRTEDGALDYPNPGNARDMAYGGTISEILDLKQVNGLVTDSAGFGLTGVATSNSDPDYSNAGPYTSTAVNKLIIQSSGARNPFGLALDGSGNLWFTNNFNRSQSDGTFNGTIDPSTGLLYGITTGDPAPGPDLANNAYDQFFEDAPLADYGYNNSNWRNDAADDNPSVTSGRPSTLDSSISPSTASAPPPSITWSRRLAASPSTTSRTSTKSRVWGPALRPTESPSTRAPNSRPPTRATRSSPAGTAPSATPPAIPSPTTTW